METVRAIGYGTLARYLRWASKVSGYTGHSSARLTTGLYGRDGLTTDLTSEVEEITKLQESLFNQKLLGTKIFDQIQSDLLEGISNEERSKRIVERVMAKRKGIKPIR